MGDLVFVVGDGAVIGVLRLDPARSVVGEDGAGSLR